MDLSLSVVAFGADLVTSLVACGERVRCMISVRWPQRICGGPRKAQGGGTGVSARMLESLLKGFWRQAQGEPCVPRATQRVLEPLGTHTEGG